MKLRQNLTRSLAASVLGLSVLGAGIATAPTASAASLPKGCVPAYGVPNKATKAVNLRSGPGTKYTSLGILSKGTRYTPTCMTKDASWLYGKVGTGPNKGRKGWVYWTYMTGA
ncbi:SH3 domain-containing protein [Streptomyces caeruleatus]|uniref:SH3 domain-containing protein n=1 Tax=Streptomyces caeruleatus TaxID=661399 RepID=UPI000A6DC05C|nr:SH3 domain-containing protein [Streptomyces caeruleatus]